MTDQIAEISSQAQEKGSVIRVTDSKPELPRQELSHKARNWLSNLRRRLGGRGGDEEDNDGRNAARGVLEEVAKLSGKEAEEKVEEAKGTPETQKGPANHAPESKEERGISAQELLQNEIGKYTDYRNENRSAEGALELFEKYIDLMDTPYVLKRNNNRMELGSIITTVMKDPSLDSTVTTINKADYSPTDSRLKGLPKSLMDNLAPLCAHSEEIEIPHDPKLIRLWNLIEKYYTKTASLLGEEKLNEQAIDAYGSNREFIAHEMYKSFSVYPISLDILYERRVEGKIIASGEFLGHGTYVSNFQKMLENGGKIKSPWHAQQTVDPELGLRSIEIDPGAIFFFSEKRRSGTFGQYADLFRGISDLGIIFPVDTIVEKGYSIGSKNGADSKSEYFVTASPDAFSENKLTPLERRELAIKDRTELDLKEAYIHIINGNKKDEIDSLLQLHGFDDEWIKEHVIVYGRYGSKKPFLIGCERALSVTCKETQLHLRQQEGGKTTTISGNKKQHLKK